MDETSSQSERQPASRPLSPRLSVYRWRAPMLASVAHRASGMALVVFVPLYLWLLHGMTGSPEDFERVRVWMHTLLGKFFLWGAGIALIYHFCNGIRFLALDAGWGEERGTLRLTARLVIGIAAVAAIVLGVLL